MDLFINDFRLGNILFAIWPIFMTLGLITAIYAMIVLAKDQKETLGIKLLVFVSFFCNSFIFICFLFDTLLF